jgi:ABC-type antimicrobial peptide transport system permease subunit
MAAKINANSYQASIDQIKKLWEGTYPKHVFSYEFMDEEIAQFYEGEKKMSILLSVFTSIAIFIGCLGLFGLATFMANQKTKEIGVRKVMGATVEGIVLMFSKEYVKLLLIGFVIASFAAWFLMGKWLDSFAYKIDFGLWIYLSGLGVTMLIAVLTVGYRSYRAATADPVKSLRYE